MQIEIKNIVFVIVFIISFGFLFYKLNRVISFLKIGKPENRFNSVGQRLINVLKISFGQSRLLREPVAGTIHFFIFWGFVLFLITVIETLIQGFYSPFTFEFLGSFYSTVTITQDIFGVLVFISVVIALLRRFLFKVERLQGDRDEKFDAALVLVLILLVVVSMFGQNSAVYASNNFTLGQNEIRPISTSLGYVFYSDGNVSSAFWFEFFWWAHIIIIFFFMNYLPYSKHFHVFTSIPNVYFSKIGEHKFALKTLNLEDENSDQFGVADIEHFSWKQLLDGFSCTECGRCSSVCPATNTGKLLSPKRIIEQIRKRTEIKAPLVIRGSESQDGKTLVNDFITQEELWACTTCMACVHECPITIEHVDVIVDMRRNLTLMDSSFPSELNSVFKNIETNFTPWAFNHQDRTAWADGLGIKTMNEDANCELLFWVGCAGSYDSRYQKVSQAFAGLLKKANVDFRILGVEEKCNGDTARRLGNEYLAQMLIGDNVKTLNKYNVKKIVTGCPHCYNSLKHEFPQFGGNYEVIHHTEMIRDLINAEKLKLVGNKSKTKITFHDSCYLGRYNNIYDAPRSSLEKIAGIELLEMNRNKDRGFCCGAGGGRMFMEETEGTRINENRTKEALETGAVGIASACPFCMTMMTDGVKAFEKSDEVYVKDIAEIVLENSI